MPGNDGVWPRFTSVLGIDGEHQIAHVGRILEAIRGMLNADGKAGLEGQRALRSCECFNLSALDVHLDKIDAVDASRFYDAVDKVDGDPQIVCATVGLRREERAISRMRRIDMECECIVSVPNARVQRRYRPSSNSRRQILLQRSERGWNRFQAQDTGRSLPQRSAGEEADIRPRVEHDIIRADVRVGMVVLRLAAELSDQISEVVSLGGRVSCDFAKLSLPHGVLTILAQYLDGVAHFVKRDAFFPGARQART